MKLLKINFLFLICFLEFASATESINSVKYESLAEGIKSVKDLSSFQSEELNKEEIQNIIIDNNPILITKLPTTTQLNEASMIRLAKKIYRFDFFIPAELRNQASVKNAFKQFNKDYSNNFIKYLEPARKYLHEGIGSALIHPDFFYDSTFVYLYIAGCTPYKRHPWEPPFMPNPYGTITPIQRQIQDEQAQFEARKSTFKYIEKKGQFDKQHVNVFLKRLPIRPLPIECFPMDFMSDETFVTTISSRHPELNFIELAYRRDPEKKLQDLFISKQIEKAPKNADYPGNLNTLLDAEEMNSLFFQKWLFSEPYVIKHMEHSIKFDPKLLEDFLKDQYRPERFFGDVQKLSQGVSTLLSKYKNDTTEEYKREQEKQMKRIDTFKCCGTTYHKELERLASEQPQETRDDSEFQIEILKKIRVKLPYIVNLIKISKLPEGLIEYLLKNCNEIGDLKYYAHSHPEETFKYDPALMNRIKDACKKDESNSSSTPSPTPTNLPNTRTIYKDGKLSVIPVTEEPKVKK